ncbi:TRAP transporter substrate-binding protein [Kiloniella sp. b19]|uniref:TRAP transporter substrate-binding protein n=1 Tax=Kiloniella sp. GXU_MW_B19 TaxID=3141326 RepID=UPI0031CDD462
MNRRDFLTGAATGLVVGAGATYVATQPSKQTETAPEAPATETKVEAPAVQTGKRELKMVTTWPKNFPGLGTGAQRLADRITSASDGKLEVKLYAAGELVPPFESFDAVSNGTADMYHGAEYYWQGKDKGFNFFAAVPFGFTANEMNAWLNYGGGQELWDELSGRFNIKAFAAGNTGVQMGGWFNKEINSIEDFQGLKIRMPGLGGEVLRRIGAAAVSLPGGEIYPSLESGAIDATEWVGPWNDLAFGFYKVTKFYYYPGFHEPGTTLSCGLNKDVWDSLSAEHQTLVQAACAAENENMLSEFNAKNGDALDTLLTKHGVELRKFSQDIMNVLGKTSEEVVAEVGNSDANTKKIYDSYFEFRRKVSRWTTLSESEYTSARSTALGN